jgi:hypothetical protein
MLRGKKYQVAGKQTCIFFLLPTASSFLITSLSGWGGMHMAGGGCTGGVGGCTCILCNVHPPWVRHCPLRLHRDYNLQLDEISVTTYLYIFLQIPSNALSLAVDSNFDFFSGDILPEMKVPDIMSKCTMKESENLCTCPQMP